MEFSIILREQKNKNKNYKHDSFSSLIFLKLKITYSNKK
jgi:hypothetical protein